MKRLFAAAAAWLLALTAWAQSSIRVEVHNIVEVQERFNVVFVVEGEHSPSDFQWDASEDFTVVWGPQKGSSTSIQMINGKTTRSSQTSYTYILQARRTGTFTLQPAVAKVKGEEVRSKAVSIQVVDGGSSQGTAQQGGSQAGSSQGSSQGGSQQAAGGGQTSAGSADRYGDSRVSRLV